MNESTEYLKIKEIRETTRGFEADKLLKEGWVLLSMAKGQEQTGPNNIVPIFKYSLGNPNVA